MQIPPFPSVGFRCPVSIETDMLERLWRWIESCNKTQDLVRKLELPAFKTGLGLSPDRHHHMPKGICRGAKWKEPLEGVPRLAARAKAVLPSRAAGGEGSPHLVGGPRVANRFPIGRGWQLYPTAKPTCRHRS